MTNTQTNAIKPSEFIQVTFIAPEGRRRANVRELANTARGLRKFSVVDKDGLRPEQPEVIIASADDILSEKKLVWNLHYGTLEVA